MTIYKNINLISNNLIKLDFLKTNIDYFNKNIKFLIFNKLIKSNNIRIILDASIDGVIVPTEFSFEKELKLDFLYNFIAQDFTFNKLGISSTLNFVQYSYLVYIPWISIYGMQDLKSKKAIIFNENISKIKNRNNFKKDKYFLKLVDNL